MPRRGIRRKAIVVVVAAFAVPSSLVVSTTGLAAHAGVPASGASGSSGALEEFVEDHLDGRTWNAYDRSAPPVNGPDIVGTPSVVNDPHDGFLHVYVEGVDDHLTEYVDSNANGHLWNAYDLTDAAHGGAAVAGVPSALFDPHDGLIHIYLRAADGHLTEYVDSGANGHLWNAWDLTAAAHGGGAVTGVPSALFDPHDDLIHVYVAAADGHLTEYVDSGANGHLWNAWDLTAAARGGGGVAGGGSALFDPHDGLIHDYVVAAAGGHLTEYVDSGANGHLWNAWDLSLGARGGSAVSADPGALFDSNDSLIHVYVRAASDDLTEYVDSGADGFAWDAWNLTQASGGGGVVVGEPSPLFDSTDGLIHVYVRGAIADADNLMEYVDSGADGHPWDAWNLTSGAGGQLVGADPAGVVDDSGVIHVFAAGLPAGATDWLVYHHDLGGSGNDGTLLGAPTQVAWNSPALDGQVYGEPLEYDGQVFVATENDAVYALSVATGKVDWAQVLGSPVPAGDLPCGDISPHVGITSTPVIDPARNEIFVVADEVVGGQVEHILHGLDVSTGTVELTQRVDPPGSDPLAILQRVALTLDAGQVVFGYGGNSGDCSDYHGWVIAVPEGGGALRTFEVDPAPGESQGAIWMGGAAPIVDGQGHVWVAAGNGSQTGGTYDLSDSVLELSSSLQLMQYFAPSDWGTQNANDEDLGSSSPAVLPNGLVFQGGKSTTGYLLRQSSLGGIGGQVAELPGLCGNDMDGGDAFVGSVVYVPCYDGLLAIQTATTPRPALGQIWQSSSGAVGPPIVAGGLVWSIGNSTLYGLDPATGNAVTQFALSGEANHFPTPSVGDGLLLAPTTNGVTAFG